MDLFHRIAYAYRFAMIGTILLMLLYILVLYEIQTRYREISINGPPDYLTLVIGLIFLLLFVIRWSLFPRRKKISQDIHDLQ